MAQLAGLELRHRSGGWDQKPITADGRPHSPASGYPPLRLVTADGTVTLSPFLHPAHEIAEATAAGNPHTHVEL